LGAQNSIAGGGRYNALIQQIGGRDTPAIGFAGGFERLLLALDKEGIQIPESSAADVYVIGMGEDTRAMVISCLTDIRKQGLYAEYNPDKTSFKAQMKAADASGAHYALIIGADELASQMPTLKNLQTSEQRQVPRDELTHILREHLV